MFTPSTNINIITQPATSSALFLPTTGIKTCSAKHLGMNRKENLPITSPGAGSSNPTRTSTSNVATRPRLGKPVVLITSLAPPKKKRRIEHDSTPSSSTLETRRDELNTGATGLASALLASFTGNFQSSISAKQSNAAYPRPIRFKQPLTPASTDDELILSSNGSLKHPSAAVEYVPSRTSTLPRSTAKFPLSEPRSRMVEISGDDDDAMLEFVPESPARTPSQSPTRSPTPSSPLQRLTPLRPSTPPSPRAEEPEDLSAPLYPLVPPPKALDAAINKRHQKRRYFGMTEEEAWVVFRSILKKPEYEVSSKTPIERYKVLLDEMFGPGDVYRGMGRKPRFFRAAEDDRLRQSSRSSGVSVPMEVHAPNSEDSFEPEAPLNLEEQAPPATTSTEDAEMVQNYLLAPPSTSGYSVRSGVSPVEPTSANTQFHTSVPLESRNISSSLLPPKPRMGVYPFVSDSRAQSSRRVSRTQTPASMDSFHTASRGASEVPSALIPYVDVPELWEKPFRKLLAGKVATTEEDLKGIDEILQDLTNSANQWGHRRSPYRNVFKYLEQIVQLPEDYIPDGDKLRLRQRAMQILALCG